MNAATKITQEKAMKLAETEKATKEKLVQLRADAETVAIKQEQELMDILAVEKTEKEAAAKKTATE